MWARDLYCMFLTKKGFSKDTAESVTNQIVQYVTGCFILSEQDVTPVEYIRDYWSGSGEILIANYQNIPLIIKSRCRSGGKKPNDQVDNEFEFMMCLAADVSKHLILPIGVCFGDNFECVQFLAFEKWHTKNLSSFVWTRYFHLPFKTKLNMFNQIVCGLKVLHDKGIVHRDMCLENVLTRDLTMTHVALADLGVSEYHDEMSMSGTVGHTSCQPLSQEPISFQYDFYGLGHIARGLFYRDMIMDAKLAKDAIDKFQETHTLEEMSKFTTAESLMMEILHIPPQTILTLIENCCSENPRLRPSNCADILQILSNV